MKRYLTVALTLGLATLVAACDDDFLTTSPQDQISDVTYWQNERDFRLAVNGIYREVLETDLFYMEGATDLSYSGKDWTVNHAVAQGHNDASHGWTNGIWARLYRGVSRANEVLNQLEATSVLTAAQKTRFESEARFLRGYFYHELLWLYGGVPIFTKVPTIAEAREVSRSSRDEVINFVLADLTAAAGGLPNRWDGDADYGRATKGAALAFKARAALYEASYNKYHANNATRANELFQVAAEAAQAVRDLNVYQLNPSFRNLFTYTGERSSEVIFDYVRVKGVNGWSAWLWFAPHSMGSDIAVSPTRALVDLFQMKDGLPITQSPLYDPAPPVIQGGQVASLGMYADRDPRFYATLLFPGGQFENTVYNSYPNSPTADKLAHNNFSNTHTGYVWLKYVDPGDRNDRTNSGLNIIRMRFADVLLMYAEAKIELNQIDASVTAALNQVRARAGMPNFALGSQAQMIALLRNERAVELAGEGLRLADIRRWKIAEQVMPGPVAGISVREGNNIVVLSGLWQRSFPAPRNYLWPVPVTERDLNANLAQNPGY